MNFKQYKDLAVKIFPDNAELFGPQVEDTRSVYENARNLLASTPDLHSDEWKSVDVFSLNHATKGRLDGSFNFD